ncbi:MAG: hypothetical protein U5P41_03040 [Gammaproteobacteria bacterium]|nr:hypothetical protein [Gammaproteobacteria bacterium]
MAILSQPLHAEHGISVAALLARARQRLAATETPRLDSELLLAHVLQTPRTHLYAHPGRILTAQQLAAYDQLLRRRAKLEPVAYLTGYQGVPVTAAGRYRCHPGAAAGNRIAGRTGTGTFTG